MRWLVLALLLIATPAQATVLWFMGVETGDTKEGTGVGSAPTSAIAITSPVISGIYAMQASHNSGVGLNNPGGTTIFGRTAFQFSASAAGVNRVVVGSSSGGKTIEVFMDNADKKLKWGHNNQTVIAAGATVLTVGVWYQIEAKMVIHASAGGVELKLCTPPPCTTSVEFTSLGTNTSDLVSFSGDLAFGPTLNPGMVFIYDDMMVCGTAYCPAGKTIARQGTAGSPTYTAWTLNSCTGGTIDGCWSETPFTATTPSASSTVLNDAQTMVVHDFATTQTGHGTETIGNTSTINACKTAMVANAGSTGTLTIRRRISGSDTDTAKSITATNAYYDDGIWTTTAGVLGNSANMQIGAVQGENTETQTVRDMWLMCDFVNASQAPKHRVIQQ